VDELDEATAAPVAEAVVPRSEPFPAAVGGRRPSSGRRVRPTGCRGGSTIIGSFDGDSAAVKVDRQFATADALVKLKRLDPVLEIVDSGMVDRQERPRSSRNWRRVRSTVDDREAVRGAVPRLPRLVGEPSRGPCLPNSGRAVVFKDFRKNRSAPT
jgi:hypothetical protein